MKPYCESGKQVIKTNKLILRNFQSPGDIVMLTAAVRDLHACRPGQFLTDVRTPCPGLWENNPHLTPLDEKAEGVEIIQCEYPLIHHSNQLPYHFLHGFIRHLGEQLNLTIEPTAFKGDIHLSEQEINGTVFGEESPQLRDALPFPLGLEGRVPRVPDISPALGDIGDSRSLSLQNGDSWNSSLQDKSSLQLPIWLVAAGGKQDFTIKWWASKRYQEVVDHFRGRIQFVQVGEAGHFHPQLDGVLDLRGKTSLRQLVRLMHHADGVLTPVSLLMHLSAAVPTKNEIHSNQAQHCSSRPCVVIAGGREPVHWEAYPTHQFIHTIGMLPCCRQGGCWKSRAVPLGDGDEKDKPESLCVDVVGTLPHCMDMITAEDVIRRIELYLQNPNSPTTGVAKEFALLPPKTESWAVAQTGPVVTERVRREMEEQGIGRGQREKLEQMPVDMVPQETF